MDLRICNVNMTLFVLHQAVPYHYKSSDRQGVVDGVSEQRPAGETYCLTDIHRQTGRKRETVLKLADI